MREIKIRNAAALLLDIAMLVLVAAAICWFFTEEGLRSGAGNMSSGGWACFIFFTNDSNVLAALCSLLLLPFRLRAFLRGRDAVPVCALLLKFIGTAAVTVTFMVVLLFLGPMMGYAKMFEGNCLALHLICPLLAIISFVFFDRGLVFSKRQALLGVLPTVIYGTVYLVNVIFRETWTDFYSFNIGGFWYISCIALPAVTYLFSLALCTAHNRVERKHTENPVP